MLRTAANTLVFVGLILPGKITHIFCYFSILFVFFQFFVEFSYKNEKNSCDLFLLKIFFIILQLESCEL